MNQAQIITQHLTLEFCRRRCTGYHVYLRVVYGDGRVYTGLLKHGRVFDYLADAQRFAEKYQRHNRKQFDTLEVLP